MVGNVITTLAKRLFTHLYYRSPGMTWDVESWLKENDAAAAVLSLEVLKETADGSGFPPPVPACAGIPPILPEPVVGTYRRYLARIRAAAITGVDGFTVMPDGKFLLQPAWVPELIAENPAYFKRRQQQTVPKSGQWFNPLMHWHLYYYHWVCQVLPRFHDVLGRLPDDVKIIVPWQMRDWMWDSLACIGIDRSRCVPYEGKHPWRLEELWYAPPVAMTGDHDRESMTWLRRTVLASLQIATSGGRRIYLSRKAGTSRSIANESELLPIFQNAGYQVVHTEDLSFAEQVSLFAGASHVIATHGGGLTNLTWAPEGCRVLEICHPETTDRKCYWTLCHAMGHVHRYMVGEAGSEAGPNSIYSVSPQRLERAIAGFEVA